MQKLRLGNWKHIVNNNELLNNLKRDRNFKIC